MNLLNNFMVDWLRSSFRKGMTFNGKRDLYEVFGYPQEVCIQDFRNLYERGDISARLVEAYPSACWSEPPTCIEDTDTQKETPWEKQVKETLEELKFWQIVKRLDILAQLGKYAVMFVGFTGNSDISRPVAKNSKPVFLLPLAEDNAKPHTYVTDVNNPRFGMPLTYKLTVASATRGGTRNIEVHYSRILHVAERALENPLEGSSILQKVYNRLLDLEKVVGSSAEIWWLNGRGGLSVETQNGVTDIEDTDGVKQSVEDYTNQLKRVITTSGLTVKPLNYAIPSPKENFEILISLVSGATAIPQRILLGSERGELASSQDDDNWNDRVEERRNTFCTPNILDAFMQLMYDVGVFEKKKHSWEWPKAKVSDAKKAETNLKRTQALVAYANSTEADSVIPPEQFVEEFLDCEYREDEINKLLEEERKQMEQDIKDGLAPDPSAPPPLPKSGQAKPPAKAA